MRAASLILSLMLVVCCAAALGAQALPDAPSTVMRAQNSPTLVPRTWGTEPEKPSQVMDAKFLLLGGLVLATTTADMELTQHCQNSGSCVELNPTIPRARWAKHAVNLPTNAAVMYWAYRWKKEGKRLWWMPPLVDIGVHLVGVGSNLRFAW